MGLLKTHIKDKEKKASKTTPGSVQDTLYMPTGFDYLDAMSGNIEVLDNGEKIYNLGMPMGKVVLYVGQSQTGKSTKAYQDGWAIVKALNGDMVVFDFERSTSNLEKRVMEVTNCSKAEFEDSVSCFKQETLTIDFVKEFIFDIVAKKRELGKSCFVDWIDNKNNDIKIYPPTVIILDSISATRSKEMLENPAADSNMVAAILAKNNSSFLQSVLHVLEAYNITLLCIGHITNKIIIDPYAPVKLQLPGLDKTDNIKGGNAFCYFSSYAYQFMTGAELNPEKDLGIRGRVTNVKILKSRSGYNEKKLPTVYTGKEGFNNLLTNYFLLKDAGKIKTNGKAGINLTNYPEFKIAQKKFIDTYFTNSVFKEKFEELVSDLLDSMLSNKEQGFTSVQVEEIAEEFEE